jgi:anti-sigma B factor antagonist
MPHTDQILARADTLLPPAFACTTTHGGLDAAWVNVVGELDIATAPELALTLHDSQQLAHLTVLDLRELAFMDCSGVHTIVNASLRARKAGRRLVLVRGRPDIYRLFTLTGSTADVDIGDPDPLQPPAPALQSSLVSQSLLRTGGTARHRGPAH